MTQFYRATDNSNSKCPRGTFVPSTLCLDVTYTTVYIQEPSSSLSLYIIIHVCVHQLSLLRLEDEYYFQKPLPNLRVWAQDL